MSKNVLATAKQGGNVAALIPAAEKAWDDVDVASDELSSQTGEIVESTEGKVADHASSMTGVVVLFTVAMAALLVTIGYLLRRSIVRPLRASVAVLQEAGFTKADFDRLAAFQTLSNEVSCDVELKADSLPPKLPAEKRGAFARYILTN